MPSSYKPQAYSSVSPYLIVDGASRTIDFLVQLFDAVLAILSVVGYFARRVIFCCCFCQLRWQKQRQKDRVS